MKLYAAPNTVRARLDTKCYAEYKDTCFVANTRKNAVETPGFPTSPSYTQIYFQTARLSYCPPSFPLLALLHQRRPSLAVRHLHRIRQRHLDLVLVEPSHGVLAHPPLRRLLALAPAADLVQRVLLGCAVQVAQLALCVRLDVAPAYKVLDAVHGCEPLARVRRARAVKRHAGRRGPAVAAKQRRQQREDEEEQDREDADEVLEAAALGLLLAAAVLRVPRTGARAGAAKLMYPDAGAAAKVEDKLRAGVKDCKGCVLA